MSKPKKPHGHYCRICGQHKANEKFSGRGHAAHICKACAKRGNKPPEVIAEPLVFIDIDDDFIEQSDDVDVLPFAPVAVPEKPKRKRKPSKEKLLRSAKKKQAKALLSEMLAGGDVSKAMIEEAAVKAKIPTEALHRAKGSLRIISVPTENGSMWRLPKRNRKNEDTE